MGVSAFLDSTAMDILQRPEGSRRFEDGEISGAIVRRQQTKRALDFDEDSDEDEEERQKKKSESLLDAPKDTADKFIEVLKIGIADAKLKHPGKTIVVVATVVGRTR